MRVAESPITWFEGTPHKVRASSGTPERDGEWLEPVFTGQRVRSAGHGGFADIHACDQGAAEHVGMEDYSLGGHGTIEGTHGLLHRGAGAAVVPSGVWLSIPRRLGGYAR